MAALAAGLASVWAATAFAGPCSDDIARVQARYDARLDAVAASGPSAPQSTAATLHRQPTPNSVAGAEVKLGELSPEKADAFAAAMKRAHEADAAGNRDACMQALGDARLALKR